MFAKHIPNIVALRFASTALTAETLPVVTIPQYVKTHIEREKRRKKLKQLQTPKITPRGGNKAFPLISGQNSDYDFYFGQYYPKNWRIPLISDHWMKKNTSGQKFTIHKHGENPSLPVIFNREGFDEKCEFSQFGLEEILLESLKNQGMVYPTQPQAQAIPEILRNRNVLFVAESGSGKTMAYVAPIIHSILHLKTEMKCHTNSPFAVIVVPGKELAEQIAQQAYSVGDPCGVDVRVLVSGGTEHKHLIPRDNTNVDVLVGTFGTLFKLFTKKVFSMRNVRHVVVDEADTLLDDSFSEEVLQLLQYLMSHNDEAHAHLVIPKVQLVLVSATQPTNYDGILCEFIPIENMIKVVSPHAHQLMPHITHKFLRVRHTIRAGVMLEIVKNDYNKNIPVMIFSNKSPTCDWMNGFLEENDIPNAKFHAGLSIKYRTKMFNDFKDGIVNVLCCTDLASRGLDAQWVKHIINFDFPNNMSDYIHRTGRIGRVGTNHGYVTNLVNTIPGADVVQQIEMAVRKSTGLPSIDANIKKKVEKLKYIEQYRS